MKPDFWIAFGCACALVVGLEVAKWIERRSAKKDDP